MKYAKNLGEMISWKCCKTLKNYEICQKLGGEWWKALFNLPLNPFFSWLFQLTWKSDFGYPIRHYVKNLELLGKCPELLEGCPELLAVKCPEEEGGRHLVSQNENPSMPSMPSIEVLINKVHNKEGKNNVFVKCLDLLVKFPE